MNLNNRDRVIAYLSVFLFFFILLLMEYTYVHPYSVPYGLLGPGWTYVSTRTFTWWFILAGSIVLVTPLIRLQKIGLLGLFLLIAVIVRPLIQIKFPREQAIDFYKDREVELSQLIKSYKSNKDRVIKSREITNIDLDQLNIHQGTYFFYLYDPEWPGGGLCYDQDGKLPRGNFGRYLKYKKLDQHWYEFKSH